jgi:hypothetical protein
MMSQKIYCHYCGGEVTTISDLMVVAYFGIIPTPYHTKCYGEIWKNPLFIIFTRSYPINHLIGNFIALSSIIASICVFFVSFFIWSQLLQLLFEPPLMPPFTLQPGGGPTLLERHPLGFAILFSLLFSLLALWPAVLRLISYLRFERPLK